MHGIREPKKNGGFWTSGIILAVIPPDADTTNLEPVILVSEPLCPKINLLLESMFITSFVSILRLLPPITLPDISPLDEIYPNELVLIVSASKPPLALTLLALMCEPIFILSTVKVPTIVTSPVFAWVKVTIESIRSINWPSVGLSPVSKYPFNIALVTIDIFLFIYYASPGVSFVLPST